MIDGTYPLGRSLFIYVSDVALEENPAVGPFVDFYLSDEGSPPSKRSSIALPDDRISATVSAWETASAWRDAYPDDIEMTPPQGVPAALLPAGPRRRPRNGDEP